MDTILEWEISVDKIFFPRYTKSVKNGEYAIFSVFVIDSSKNITQYAVLKGTLTCDLDTKSRFKVQVKGPEKDREGRESYELIYINRKINLKSVEGQRGFLEMILPKNTVNELLKTHSMLIKIPKQSMLKTIKS